MQVLIQDIWRNENVYVNFMYTGLVLETKKTFNINL